MLQCFVIGKRGLCVVLRLPRYPSCCGSGFERTAIVQTGPHYEQKKTKLNLAHNGMDNALFLKSDNSSYVTGVLYPLIFGKECPFFKSVL